MRLPVPKEVGGWHRRCSVCFTLFNADDKVELLNHIGHRLYPVTFVTLREWLRLKLT